MSSINELKGSQVSANLAQARLLENVGLSATGSGSLVISLKQSDGVTDPATSGKVRVGYKAAAVTPGIVIIGDTFAAQSITLPGGGTLGTVASATDATVFVYQMLNPNNIDTQLGISLSFYEDNSLVTSSAVGTGSDSSTTMYTTVAEVSRPVRLLGYVVSQNAAGTSWSTPTVVNLGRRLLPPTKDYYGTTGTTTWVRPEGCIAVEVMVYGSGGGGGGVITSDADEAIIGGSGGGGAYSESYIVYGLSNAQTMTIATGGAGGNTSGTAGGAGSGSTSFGALVISPAGSGGTGDASSNPATATVAGGAGGVAGTGNFTTTGGPGGHGHCVVIATDAAHTTFVTSTIGGPGGRASGPLGGRGGLWRAGTANGGGGDSPGGGGSAGSGVNGGGGSTGGVGARGEIHVICHF